MRRKIKKIAFNNMSLHSMVRTMNLTVLSACEDDTYYYLNTNVAVGEADEELKEGDKVKTLYTVKFNNRFDIEKAIRKFESDFNCTVDTYTFHRSSERKFNVHFLEVYATVNRVVEDVKVYRASYGFGYLIKD